MGALRRHRVRRIAASSSPILFGGGLAIIGTAIAILKYPSESRPQNFSDSFGWALLIGGVIGTALLSVQCWAEYRKRTYDPTWVRKFDERFTSKEMLEIRSLAATKLKSDGSKLAHEAYTSVEIDNILDFLQDLGFYMRGDQMTPEVTQHAFYYWIRGYYLIAKGYLQKERVERPAQWESVKPLFEMTREVEIENNKGKPEKEFDADNFLKDEIALVSKKRISKKKKG